MLTHHDCLWRVTPTAWPTGRPRMGASPSKHDAVDGKYASTAHITCRRWCRASSRRYSAAERGLVAAARLAIARRSRSRSLSTRGSPPTPLRMHLYSTSRIVSACQLEAELEVDSRTRGAPARRRSRQHRPLAALAIPLRARRLRARRAAGGGGGVAACGVELLTPSLRTRSKAGQAEACASPGPRAPERAIECFCSFGRRHRARLQRLRSRRS